MPEVYLIGGIVFPIAIIIAILDEFNLPIKPALFVLFINNLLGIIWTIKNGGYSYNNEVEVFGIVFSFVSTLGIIILFFVKQLKRKVL